MKMYKIFKDELDMPLAGASLFNLKILYRYTGYFRFSEHPVHLEKSCTSLSS
jgi:hypothetical protein